MQMEGETRQRYRRGIRSASTPLEETRTLPSLEVTAVGNDYFCENLFEGNMDLQCVLVPFVKQGDILRKYVL